MKGDQSQIFSQRFGPKFEKSNGATLPQKSSSSKNDPIFLSGLGIWLILFLLILLWIIIASILYLIAPVFVLEPDYSSVDPGKLALVSLIVALLSIILIWLVLSFRNYGNTSRS